LLFLKRVVNFGRNFSNFDKLSIINLGLAVGGDVDFVAGITKLGEQVAGNTKLK
jgi:hypothetical protein